MKIRSKNNGLEVLAKEPLARIVEVTCVERVNVIPDGADVFAINRLNDVRLHQLGELGETEEVAGLASRALRTRKPDL